MLLLIMAKEPRPGFAKTRLIPVFGPEGAAKLAQAALADTFEAASRCAAERVVVAFDGNPVGLVPSEFDVIAQRSGPLDVRLAAAWSDAGGPALQIGMDTPQVTAQDLDVAMATLAELGTDAVLGPAVDGGWWAIGLHQPDPKVFIDVPMSRPDTGALQLTRLRQLGLHTTLLAQQRDVDHPADVELVASANPGGRFAEVARTLLASDAPGTGASAS